MVDLDFVEARLDEQVCAESRRKQLSPPRRGCGIYEGQKQSQAAQLCPGHRSASALRKSSGNGASNVFHYDVLKEDWHSSKDAGSILSAL